MQVTVFEITDTGAVQCAQHEAPAQVNSMQLNSSTLLLLAAGVLLPCCKRHMPLSSLIHNHDGGWRPRPPRLALMRRWPSLLVL